MLQGFEVVFSQEIFSNSDLARDSSRTNWLSSAHLEIGIHGTFRKLDGGKVYPSLWLDQFPLLSLHNVRISIENAVTILVTEWSTSGGIVPVWVVRVYDPAGPDCDVLDISPRQLGPRWPSDISRMLVLVPTEHQVRGRKHQQHWEPQRMSRHVQMNICRGYRSSPVSGMRM